MPAFAVHSHPMTAGSRLVSAAFLLLLLTLAVRANEEPRVEAPGTGTGTGTGCEPRRLSGLGSVRSLS